MHEPVDILLVEDNPGDARLIDAHLGIDTQPESRWTLAHVTTLAAAVDHARTLRPDVILLDLSLPDAHGLESCSILQRDVPDCPPIIVLTGLRDREVATAAVAGGAQDFLMKDAVDHEVLVRSIRYAMERHRAHADLQRALAREQQMVGQLQQLDRLKNRFVAMASHELRTPLASIGGFASTLHDRWEEIAPEDRRTYIDIINEQSQRLTRLVDDLLVLSRIESGSINADPEPVGLDRAIRLVLAELNALDPVEVIVPPMLEVFADRDHLEQMLVNYVSNALKYGEQPISVECALVNGYIDVYVRDQGSGVPAELEPMLFEEFARAAQTSRQIPGTGLGLSIVRGLARAQGGDAWYEPNLPRGATFALRLPAAG